MNSSMITNSKNSNAPGAAWNDDGRVNLLLFPSENAFQAFLESLGVPKTLLTSPPNNVVTTYANVAGYIILFSNIKKYTTAYHNGVKKGQSATFNFGPEPQILAVFNNQSWYMYVKQQIKPGTNYTVTALKPTTSGGSPSGTIVPS